MVRGNGWVEQENPLEVRTRRAELLEAWDRYVRARGLQIRYDAELFARFHRDRKPNEDVLATARRVLVQTAYEASQDRKEFRWLLGIDEGGTGMSFTTRLLEKYVPDAVGSWRRST